MPTASAVVGDLIDVLIGRAAPDRAGARPLVRGRRPWSPPRPADQARSRFYLRFSIADRPGVIAAIVPRSSATTGSASPA